MGRPKILSICTAEGCDRPAAAKGLCQMHWKRQHKRPCKIEGCDKPVVAFDMCYRHWDRWRRYGDPLAGRTFNGEPERFYQETVLTYDGDDCLLWPYAKTPQGYAMMRVKGSAQSITVHRRLCEEVNGPPPGPGYDAGHSCNFGTTGCVARAHVFWQTRVDNIADREQVKLAKRSLHGPSPIE
jgi:hypothetical protein